MPRAKNRKSLRRQHGRHRSGRDKPKESRSYSEYEEVLREGFKQGKNVKLQCWVERRGEGPRAMGQSLGEERQ